MAKLDVTPDQLIDALRAEKESGHLTAEHIQSLADLISDVRPDVAGKFMEEKSITEIKIPRSPATVELIKRLEAQYGECLTTLKHYGFLTENGEAKEGDINPPSFEKVMVAFIPEEFEIASHFQKPVLLLIPETSFTAKVKAMDAHKQKGQKYDTLVEDIYKKTDSGSDKITGWRVVIADGAQEMRAHKDTRPDLHFGARIMIRKGVRKIPYEKGMDRHKYILLMMDAIRSGKPIDKKSRTILDDDPVLSDSQVPNAGFDPEDLNVHFGWSIPISTSKTYCFRSSVGGDVLIS